MCYCDKHDRQMVKTPSLRIQGRTRWVCSDCKAAMAKWVYLFLFCYFSIPIVLVSLAFM